GSEDYRLGERAGSVFRQAGRNNTHTVSPNGAKFDSPGRRPGKIQTGFPKPQRGVIATMKKGRNRFIAPLQGLIRFTTRHLGRCPGLTFFALWGLAFLLLTATICRAQTLKSDYLRLIKIAADRGWADNPKQIDNWKQGTKYFELFGYLAPAHPIYLAD